MVDHGYHECNLVRATLVYQEVERSGLPGCLAVLIAAMAMERVGIPRVGRRGFYRESVAPLGWRRSEHVPAVEGMADTWLGRGCGHLLKMTGRVLMIISIIAGLRLTLFSTLS